MKVENFKQFSLKMLCCEGEEESGEEESGEKKVERKEGEKKEETTSGKCIRTLLLLSH